MDSSVASTLKEARDAKGLELSDIAEITNVRKEYLKALEEGRYSDLPEDIYSRNFLRLYAQALGLEDSKLLDQYTRERRSALGISPNELRKTEVIQAESSPRRNPTGWILTLLLLAALGGLFYFAYSRNLLATLFRPRVAPTITEPTLPDVSEDITSVEEVLEPPVLDETATPETSNESLALDETSDEAQGVQNSSETEEAIVNTEATLEEPLVEETLDEETLIEETLVEEPLAEENSVETETAQADESETTIEESNPNNNSISEEPDPNNVAAAANLTPELTPSSEASDVRFTLITDPPGADASLDNYPFASRTPVFNAPVSARDSRVLRIDLDGFEPYTELIDVLEDTSLSITLRPLGAEEANILNPETQSSATTPAVAATLLGQPIQGQLRLQVEAETWLEVYQSTERGEGEQLYYGTAQTGEALNYNLPVYIHVGNAAGIRITENGRDVGLMGSSGEVTGRSFGQPLPVTETPVIENPETETTDGTTLDENTNNENPTEPQTTGNE